MTSTSPRKPTSSLWKGKAKATEADYDDLNPVITYRHLHSQNLGVKDPLRVIALCDSDAFYATCEQVRLGADPLEPLVVSQWESLIAVNYPARKFGISRMDKVKDAKKRCPHLRVVHVATYKEGEKEPGYWENPDTLTHKVSLDYYRRESSKIIQMFKDGLPNGEIERASIDEAFIDFTRPVREEILKRYPYLAEVPRDAPDGKDSPLPPPPPIVWDERSTIIPITPPPPDIPTEGAPAKEENEAEKMEVKDGNGEGGGEKEDGTCTWHDVALSIAVGLMAKVRLNIHTKLGYTTSAGIARNKFLAKLTASYKKPNSQSVLRNAAIPNYLKPMAFQRIRFLGGKLGNALAEEYDVSTVGDLLTISLEEMQHKFGEESIWVYEILRGIDRSEVKVKPSVTKSMLASKNLPKPIVETPQGHHWIRVLAAELALRLREGRVLVPALWPKTIVLHIRQGYESSRSKQVPFPFARDITVDLIAAAGDKLWKDLVGTEDTRKTPMKITNVQLSFSGLDSMETGQRSIEGFFKPGSSPAAAPFSPNMKRKRDDSEDDDNSVTEVLHDNPHQSASLRGGGTSESVAPNAIGAPSSDSPSLTFLCDRCNKRVSLPDALAHMEDDDLRRKAMATLKQEHDDWHFAQDLSRQAEPYSAAVGPKRAIRPHSKASSSKPASSERPAPKGRKKGKEPDPGPGIAQFFSKS